MAAFGYLFGVPWARLGTLGSHFGDFGRPLDPRAARKAIRRENIGSLTGLGGSFWSTFGILFGTSASQI